MTLCRSCDHDFASLPAFDRHRVGKHAYTYSEGASMEPPREDGRRCLSVAEMLKHGMSLNSRGRWQIDAKAEHARQRFRDTPKSLAGFAERGTEG